MSNLGYCRKRGTQRVLVATPYLLSRPDIERVDGPQTSAVAQPVEQGETQNAIVIDGTPVSLRRASKQDMAAYAERHFGAALDQRRSRDALADQVRALIAEHGHPDE